MIEAKRGLERLRPRGRKKKLKVSKEEAMTEVERHIHRDRS